jgi:hypothetical protein
MQCAVPQRVGDPVARPRQMRMRAGYTPDAARGTNRIAAAPLSRGTRELFFFLTFLFSQTWVCCCGCVGLLSECRVC